MSSDAEDSAHLRLSMLEAKFNALETTSTSTATATTSSSGKFTPIAEVNLGLTQDGAWHDNFSAPGVPSNATALLLAVRYDITAAPAGPQQFKITTDISHATFATGGYFSWHIGANGLIIQNGNFIAPVGQTFSYYLDNDASITVTVYLQGYFV